MGRQCCRDETVDMLSVCLHPSNTLTRMLAVAAGCFGLGQDLPCSEVPLNWLTSASSGSRWTHYIRQLQLDPIPCISHPSLAQHAFERSPPSNVTPARRRRVHWSSGEQREEEQGRAASKLVQRVGSLSFSSSTIRQALLAGCHSTIHYHLHRCTMTMEDHSSQARDSLVRMVRYS